MKKTILLIISLANFQFASAQVDLTEADQLRNEGLLMPALMKYGEAMMQSPSEEISYKIATTTALLWSKPMIDTSFYFLNFALQHDSSLEAIYDPDFLSLISDPRWEKIEEE